MIGRPMVTLTAWPNASSFTGIVPLVVITREHAVELAFRRPHEHGVGGKRSADVHAPRSRRGGGRRQHAIVFGAEDATLAGMRIEPGNRQSRADEAELRQRLAHVAIVRSTSSRVIIDGTSLSGTCTVINTTFSSGAWNIIATRGVPHRCASKSVWLFPRQPGLRKPACSRARSQSHPLHRSSLPPLHERSCRVRFAGLRRDFADADLERRRREHHRLAHRADARIGDGLLDDLGPDACGITTDGQRNARPSHRTEFCVISSNLRNPRNARNPRNPVYTCTASHSATSFVPALRPGLSARDPRPRTHLAHGHR